MYTVSVFGVLLVLCVSELTMSDPLLMNAFNNVNLAAACIVTSTSKAEGLGIPRSKWIYPLAGSGTADTYDCKLCAILCESS
jgi:hypothetical protein